MSKTTHLHRSNSHIHNIMHPDGLIEMHDETDLAGHLKNKRHLKPKA